MHPIPIIAAATAFGMTAAQAQTPAQAPGSAAPEERYTTVRQPTEDINRVQGTAELYGVLLPFLNTSGRRVPRRRLRERTRHPC